MENKRRVPWIGWEWRGVHAWDRAERTSAGMEVGGGFLGCLDDLYTLYIIPKTVLILGLDSILSG